MIEGSLDLVQDPVVREFLQRIREEFDSQTLLRGKWRFMELSFTSNITNFTVAHGLGFMPKDLFQTGKTGTGSITYNYSRFDSTNIDVTTSGTSASDPLVVRFFVGRYEGDSLV